MKTKKLDRVTLKRGNRTIVLQGMIHVGTIRFYRFVQRNIIKFKEEGSIIFYEGVKKEKNDELQEMLTEDQLNIVKMFSAITSCYPLLARQTKRVLQHDHVRYYRGAVRADVTFGQVAQMLDDQGFCSHKKVLDFLLSERFKLAQRKDIRPWSSKSAIEKITFLVNIVIALPILLPFFCALWFMFIGPFFSVVLKHRNRVAMEMVLGEIARSNKDGFVIYGGAHIRGMVRILKFHGWEVIKRQKIAL